MTLSLIVAADENNVIGGANKLLWDMPVDMQHFRSVTEGHPVIMGRKTYESIGRPLPRRQNIVVSREEGLEIEGCEVVGSLNEAMQVASGKWPVASEVFVIGGGEIYKQALPMANKIYLTRVHAMFQGDTTFPELSKDEWQEVSHEFHAEDEHNPHACTFFVYERQI